MGVKWYLRWHGCNSLLGEKVKDKFFKLYNSGDTDIFDGDVWFGYYNTKLYDWKQNKFKNKSTAIAKMHEFRNYVVNQGGKIIISLFKGNRLYGVHSIFNEESFNHDCQFKIKESYVSGKERLFLHFYKNVYYRKIIQKRAHLLLK